MTPEGVSTLERKDGHILDDDCVAPLLRHVAAISSPHPGQQTKIKQRSRID